MRPIHQKRRLLKLGKKRCCKCSQVKPLIAFHKNRGHLGGVDSHCRLCESIRRGCKRHLPPRTGGTIQPLNRYELAWAAGFFDGEGSTCYSQNLTCGNGNSLIYASVGQSGEYAEEILLRFKAAVGGFGNVRPGAEKDPRGNRQLLWKWTGFGFIKTQAILSMLWPWLSSAKKKQYEIAAIKWKKDHFPQIITMRAV